MKMKILRKGRCKIFLKKEKEKRALISHSFQQSKTLMCQNNSQPFLLEALSYTELLMHSSFMFLFMWWTFQDDIWNNYLPFIFVFKWNVSMV